MPSLGSCASGLAATVRAAVQEPNRPFDGVQGWPVRCAGVRPTPGLATILMTYLTVFATGGGLVILTVGAELLVRAASSISRRVGISPLVIGLTVVSIGTSLPELVVSLDAVVQSNVDLGIGNVVGSNISNIALILGVAALVRPIHVQAQMVRVDGPILVVVSVLLVALVFDGEISSLDGAMLTVGLVAYVGYTVWVADREPGTVQKEFDAGIPRQKSFWRDVFFFVLGLAGLIWGADLMVDGAIRIARTVGVSQLVIGLTVVAVGTSLPELATSVLAAWRGNGDIAVGNAVGSSIFNILGILGGTALIEPLVTTSLTVVQLAVLVGVAVLVLPLMRTSFTLSRAEGFGLVVLYVGYVAYLFVGG